MKKAFCAAALCTMTGCVTVTEENAASIPLRDLCQITTGNSFSVVTDQGVRAASLELQRRKPFPYNEMQAVLSGYVEVGMSEEAAICALGGYPTDVNTTVTRYGRSKQYVFGDFRTGPVSYLYTENGRVTAFQN